MVLELFLCILYMVVAEAVLVGLIWGGSMLAFRGSDAENFYIGENILKPDYRSNASLLAPEVNSLIHNLVGDVIGAAAVIAVIWVIAAAVLRQRQHCGPILPKSYFWAWLGLLVLSLVLTFGMLKLDSSPAIESIDADWWFRLQLILLGLSLLAYWPAGTLIGANRSTKPAVPGGSWLL